MFLLDLTRFIVHNLYYINGWTIMNCFVFNVVVLFANIDNFVLAHTVNFLFMNSGVKPCKRTPNY